MHSIEGFNPDTLARTLHDLHGKTKGVGVIALDHPTVREAIRALSASGVKVVTLATDILHVPRVAYVGIDNRQAGRLAGYVLGRFLGTNEPKKVAMFAGSLSYRGHEEREMGFRHVLAEEFPNLTIVELREMRDDREKAYAEAAVLLDRYDDLAGIYNIGAGNQGVARALRSAVRERSVVFIGHEAYGEHQASSPRRNDGRRDRPESARRSARGPQPAHASGEGASPMRVTPPGFTSSSRRTFRKSDRTCDRRTSFKETEIARV